VYIREFNDKHYTTNRIIYLDRDGVLNEKIEGGYVLEPSQIVVRQPSLLKMALEVTPYVFVVSNQRCIQKGLLTIPKLDEIDDYLWEQIGARPYAVIYATNADCKPSTNMIYEAREMVGKKCAEMFFGDSECDRECAESAGIPFIMISGDFWSDFQEGRFKSGV